jgi:methylglutaconyl-CoA hydratase
MASTKARASSAGATPKGRTSASAVAPYTALSVETRNAVALITLNRPDVHNAFDETLIAELTRSLRATEQDDSVRAVVLLGAGNSFCAGADLNWMRKMAGFSRAQNLADARALSTMLSALANHVKPTIARVHGAAFGGGVGLVACCDIAVAAHDATFAFSEARLGLIPATIGPYVVEAIGVRAARRFFLTAERFTAAEAYRLGLVHDLVPPEELDGRINEILGFLVTAGPQAQVEAKALLRAIAHRPISPAIIASTARRIARIRASVEGKEGVAAFLAKRRAAWVPKGE